MSNPFSNFFGSIAGGFGKPIRGGAKDFIPLNGNDAILTLTGKGATWLGLRSPQMQYWAYIYCAPLASVIDRLGEADSNGKLSIVKDDKFNQVSQSAYAKRMMKLLSRPNPMQTWKQFRAQQVVYKKINGWCPVWVMMPSGMSAKDDPSFAQSVWNLPPWLCTIQKGPKVIGGTSVIDMWQTLHINIFGQDITLTPDNFFTVDDGMVADEWNNYLTPISKIAGLDWAVSNVMAAMEADNVLLRKKGPLGFISHDAAATKDSVAGYIPMGTKEKQEIQENLNNYGMSWDQFQYVISRTAVKWNPISFSLKDLMTKETVKQGIETICDRFNYPFPLLANEKGTTFSNQSGAERGLYQNNVILNNDGDMEEYNFFFKMRENGILFQTDFNHLPIMQEDANREGLALQGKTDAYITQYQNDVLTLNQLRMALGQEEMPDGNIYYSQTEMGKNATAAEPKSPQSNTGNGETTPASDRAS